MRLVRLKQKGQVTIPAKLRKGLGLEERALLEAGRILLTPKALVDRLDRAADGGQPDEARVAVPAGAAFATGVTPAPVGAMRGLHRRDRRASVGAGMGRAG